VPGQPSRDTPGVPQHEDGTRCRAARRAGRRARRVALPREAVGGLVGREPAIASTSAFGLNVGAVGRRRAAQYDTVFAAWSPVFVVTL
jgi:hypothetical protein